MIGTILRTGNTLAITIPDEMLDALQLAEGEEVSIELDTEGARLVIAANALASEGVDAHFAKQVADFIQEYRPALVALAK